MRRLIPLFLISLLVVALFPVNSLSAEYYMITKPANANIRSGPGTKHGKVAKVKKGTRLKIVARNKQKSLKKIWFKVETPDGTMGWIAGRLKSKFLRAQGPSMVTPPLPDSMQEYELSPPAEGGGEAASPAAEAPTDTAQPPADTGATEEEIPLLEDIEILDIDEDMPK